MLLGQQSKYNGKIRPPDSKNLPKPWIFHQKSSKIIDFSWFSLSELPHSKSQQPTCLPQGHGGASAFFPLTSCSLFFSVISRNSSWFRLFGANFLDSVSVDVRVEFFSAAINIQNKISYVSKLETMPGSMLLDLDRLLSKPWQTIKNRTNAAKKCRSEISKLGFFCSKISKIIENPMKIEKCW